MMQDALYSQRLPHHTSHSRFLRLENLAQIYTMVGEYDAAVDKLEYLLSVPSLASTILLQLDPRWDPLRDHPRFQALLDKY